MTQSQWRRRTVLAGLSGAALAGSAQAVLAKANFPLPDGVCDCHVHIYDTRFAYRADLPVKPTLVGTIEDYQAQVQRELGISRAIVVTASAYGTDNAVTLDALRHLGPQARGSVIIRPDLPAADLKALHAAGVRGARILPTAVADIEPLAARVASMGWHIQLSLGGNAIAELEPILMRLPLSFILDHFAHVPMPDGLNSPVYTAARRMVDSGKAWVKLSVPYDDSKIGPPDYPDVSAVARDYVLHAPERLVWATAWPYAAAKPYLTPDAMTNILAAWSPDAKVRHRILVENPEKLYGFDPKNRPKAG